MRETTKWNAKARDERDKKIGYKGKGWERQQNGITEPITVQRHVFEVDNNKLKRKLVFIFSDSILNQVDKERLSNDRYEVKLESRGGCTIEGMYTHLPSVLPLKPQYILLHLGTNDCTNNTSDSVLKRLITLKKHIEKLLPSCKVCFSLPTLRTNTIIQNLNTKLKKWNYLLEITRTKWNRIWYGRVTFQ